MDHPVHSRGSGIPFPRRTRPSARRMPSAPARTGRRYRPARNPPVPAERIIRPP